MAQGRCQECDGAGDTPVLINPGVGTVSAGQPGASDTASARQQLSVARGAEAQALGPAPQCPQQCPGAGGTPASGCISPNQAVATLKVPQSPSEHSFSLKLMQQSTATPSEPAKTALNTSRTMFPSACRYTSGCASVETSHHEILHIYFSRPTESS